MKVLSYYGSPIKVIFGGKDYWRLENPVDIEVKTDEGVYRWHLKAGYPTNMRSGSDLINSIIPKFSGNNNYNLAILLHDANYSKNEDGHQYVSKAMADDFLIQMTKVSGTLSAFKRGLVSAALKMFGGCAYYGENSWDEEKYLGAFSLSAK